MNREFRYSGGYNAVEATIQLLKEAIKGNFDYYILLQGKGYPICSNEEIEKFLLKNEGLEFLRGVCETDAERKYWHKYCLKYYMDNPNFLKKIKNRLNALLWNKFMQISKKPQILIEGNIWKIYKGSALFGLTGEAACYIINFHDTHIGFNRFFKHVYAPDESYFCTIIFNTKFRDKTYYGGPNLAEERGLEQLRNLTYFEYPKDIRVFKNKEDYQLLKNTGYLFFRKADSSSGALLDEIDLKTGIVK